jgi:hypothetical protein
MRGLYFTGILLFFILKISAKNPVSFPSEFIDFKIDSSYFSINGIYTFRNNTGTISNSNILFPFAIKTALVDSIKIINLSNFRTVNYTKLEQSISFNLHLLPSDSVEYNIFYRQHLEKKNTYILTTTKSWGAPLEKAVYTLTTGRNMKISSFSINPDSSKTDNFIKTYFWTKYKFTPQSDFEVIIENWPDK